MRCRPCMRVIPITSAGRILPHERVPEALSLEPLSQLVFGLRCHRCCDCINSQGEALAAAHEPSQSQKKNLRTGCGGSSSASLGEQRTTSFNPQSAQPIHRSQISQAKSAACFYSSSDGGFGGAPGPPFPPRGPCFTVYPAGT